MAALARVLILCLTVPLVGCGSELLTLGRSESDPAFASRGSAGAPSRVVCETTSRTTMRRPAALVFAFDVSGSMGRLDCPFWNHDPKFKWHPVVAATRAFFEDVAQRGVEAALLLFPSRADSCSLAGYSVPDVPFTQLPSGKFGEVLTSYEVEVGLSGYTDPMSRWGGTWRGGTPTGVAALAGVELLRERRSKEPALQAAMVLVTDGLPAGCGEDSEVFADLIKTLSDARLSGITTHVIGVREPILPSGAEAPWEDEGARVWACKSDAGNWLWNYNDPLVPMPVPDNLANLHAIAAAGGTERAVLIETGDPAKTKDTLATAIEKIRLQTIPCSLDIPAPPSDAAPLDADKLDVSLSAPEGDERLPYDPDCADSGGWHYDDVLAPKSLVLCPKTCAAANATLEMTLRVDFLCEARKPFVK